MSATSWIDREEYPFASHYFKLAAGTMHYVDEGSGSPVLMLHGNPTWSFLYRNLVKCLRAEHRCVAPDHLGFGLSDKPAGWSYLPAAHAANLAALIDALGLKRITLVMQDWGGPIGLAYATAHPENVARIVLMNSWAWPVNRDPYYILFSGIMGGPIGRMLIRRYNFFATSVMRQAFGDNRRLSAATHEQYLRPLANPADRTGCMVFPRQIVGSTAWLAGIWGKIGALRNTPTLIVWGMKDIAFREKELKQWQRAFPGARTVRLDTVGHYVQEEAPAELSRALAGFLQSTASA